MGLETRYEPRLHWLFWFGLTLISLFTMLLTAIAIVIWADWASGYDCRPLPTSQWGSGCREFHTLHWWAIGIVSVVFLSLLVLEAAYLKWRVNHSVGARLSFAMSLVITVAPAIVGVFLCFRWL